MDSSKNLDEQNINNAQSNTNDNEEEIEDGLVYDDLYCDQESKLGTLIKDFRKKAYDILKKVNNSNTFDN